MLFINWLICDDFGFFISFSKVKDCFSIFFIFFFYKFCCYIVWFCNVERKSWWWMIIDELNYFLRIKNIEIYDYFKGFLLLYFINFNSRGRILEVWDWVILGIFCKVFSNRDIIFVVGVLLNGGEMNVLKFFIRFVEWKR